MSHAHAAGPNSDESILADWVGTPRLSLSESIPSGEAIRFVSDTLEKLGQKIFDPDFKAAERTAIGSKYSEKIKHSAVTTRGAVLGFLNDEFRALKVSHLGILNPDRAAVLFSRLEVGEKNDGNLEASAVNSKMYGDIGVVAISSFLVPEITRDRLNRALQSVRHAKILLYDLRNNGGGSASSVVYAAERIVGPAKTIQFTRTRGGLNLAKPFVKHGWIDDAKNSGSDGDIELERQKKFVERRTRKSAKKETRPIFLLINDTCASSCEVFAGAIHAHSAATILGKKTAGSVLGSIGVKLSWRGFVAIFPTAQVLSPKARPYEGIGVEPDVNLPLTGESESDLQLALAQIKKTIK